MLEFATHVGPAGGHILLLGEPGSGKGYLARILHDLSSRAGGPFVAQNCGVFTESLAEAKLFGNVRGAYTGATDSRAGLVEAAAGGTLFLDELGALPSAVQPMLLTLLETGEFSRMGSTSVRNADIRVIAATNRDLCAAIADGMFRRDLVARFSPRFIVPPLRERRREIEGIVRRFLREAHAETDVKWRLTETAIGLAAKPRLAGEHPGAPERPRLLQALCARWLHPSRARREGVGKPADRNGTEPERRDGRAFKAAERPGAEEGAGRGPGSHGRGQEQGREVPYLPTRGETREGKMIRV
ncbi:MAG: sigma-54 factor interaction domain-containing protein, partial [Gemmatimonadota bacterium]|nr:sigma-54 factor interaction domain-containing protein [Gemmatimonadota bacterium]